MIRPLVLGLIPALLVAQPPAARAVPMVVSTEWLAAHLHDPDLVVLTLSHRMVADTGPTTTIPGAHNLPYMALIETVNGVSSELPAPDSIRHLFESLGVSDRSHVVLTGSPLVVTRAFYTLDYIGFDRASGLDGGLTKWVAEGRPTQTGPSAVGARGRLTARPPRTGIVVTTDWVRLHAGKPGYAFVDTRTDSEYYGLKYATGHIEGARQLMWETMFASPAEFSPVDRTSLERIMSEHAAPGDTLVAYCQVGYRASGTYFIARLLGLPVKLYDGSYEAWSKAQLPTVTAGTPLRKP